MKRVILLLTLCVACTPPTRFLCDPTTGADCLPDGGSLPVDGGGAGGGAALSCDQCSANGLGEAACVQGRCVITCNAGTLPTPTGCELPVEVAVSKVSVCVRSAQGHVGCAGLTGTGHVPTTSALAPTTLPELATGLSAGGGSVCATTMGGHVHCWGSNSRGELGNGALSTAELLPTQVAANDLVSVTQSGLHGCALRTDAGAVCWGSNLDRIGFAPGSTSVTTPVPVNGQTLPLVQVRAHDYPTVGLTADGRVEGWGPTFLTPNDTVQAAVSGARVLQFPFRARTLDVGPSARFIVDVDGGLWVWGSPPNSFGNSSPLIFNADAGAAGFSYEPLRTTAPPDVVEVCHGNAHVCVLTGSGAVWCWGDNTFGQLGDGAYVARGTPMVVPNVTATSLSCSDDFTCVTTASGVVCWGRNVSERLGTSLPMQSPVPRLVQARGP